MKDFIVYIKPFLKDDGIYKSVVDLNKRLIEAGKKFSLGLENTAKTFNNEIEKGNKKTIKEFKEANIDNGLKLLTFANLAVMSLKTGFNAITGIFRKATANFDTLNEKINSNLKKADTLTTEAESYGTTGAKYLLTSLAFKRKGIDNDTLKMMLLEFRQKLADAKIDINEGKGNFLSNYVNDEDTLEMMLRAISQIQKIKNKTDRDKVMTTLFNTRQMKVLGELLNSPIEELINDTRKRVFGNVSDENINKGLNRLSNLEELQAFYNARREFTDLKKGWENITKGQVVAQGSLQETKMDNIYKQMNSYEIQTEILKKMDNLNTRMTEISLKTAEIANNTIDAIQKFSFWEKLFSEIKDLLKNSIKLLDFRNLLKIFPQSKNNEVKSIGDLGDK